MDGSMLASCQRLENNDIGIYVNPDYPDWFVPTGLGD